VPSRRPVAAGAVRGAARWEEDGGEQRWTAVPRAWWRTTEGARRTSDAATGPVSDPDTRPGRDSIWESVRNPPPDQGTLALGIGCAGASPGAVRATQLGRDEGCSGDQAVPAVGKEGPGVGGTGRVWRSAADCDGKVAVSISPRGVQGLIMGRDVLCMKWDRSQAVGGLTWDRWQRGSGSRAAGAGERKAR